MLLTRSLWIKALVTTVATGGFISLYEVTMRDTREHVLKGPPAAGDRITLSATAYCKGSVTASGVAVQAGAAAADRDLLPLGSIIQLETGDPRYDGMYTVLDTGPEIKGQEVDIYMWSCIEALDFGRRSVRMKVVRLGWDPRATAPAPRLLDRLLRRQSRAKPAAPPPPDPLPEQPVTVPALEPPQSEAPAGETPQTAPVPPEVPLTTAAEPPVQ